MSLKLVNATLIVDGKRQDYKKDLKKLFDAVEIKRKELKKALAEPYNQLEVKIKELENLIENGG